MPYRPIMAPRRQHGMAALVSAAIDAAGLLAVLGLIACFALGVKP